MSSTPDLYLSVKASLSNWMDTLTSAQLFDFDSTAEEESLPQVDLVGPLEFYMEVNDTMGTVGVKVAAVTHEDPQIQRLNGLTNDIMNGCQGKAVRVPILHFEKGIPLGYMVSSGNVLGSPVVRLQTRTRPLQTVALNFKMTLTA